MRHGALPLQCNQQFVKDFFRPGDVDVDVDVDESWLLLCNNKRLLLADIFI